MPCSPARRSGSLWSPDLIAWFNQNYRLISSSYGAQVFQFIGVLVGHQPTTWWPLVAVSSAAIGSLFGFATSLRFRPARLAR